MSRAGRERCRCMSPDTSIVSPASKRSSHASRAWRSPARPMAASACRPASHGDGRPPSRCSPRFAATNRVASEIESRHPDVVSLSAKLLSCVRRGWLATWAAAMALLGWGLMTLGAFVRASESGLGCPDWPSCHGQLVVGGHHALIEEIHRWVGTVLVIGVMSLVVIILRRYRSERRVLIPTLWMVALLALQVVLGGVTVLLKNVSWTVVAHYGGASLLIASITLVAVRLAFPTAEPAPHDSV